MLHPRAIRLPSANNSACTIRILHIARKAVEGPNNATGISPVPPVQIAISPTFLISF